MNKVVPIEKALDTLKNGQSLMIGGFAGIGTPEAIIEGIISRGIKDFTVIANDTGLINKGIGKLVVHKLVRKAIVSHIGTNPETGRQFNAGEIQLELVPQGTLIEKIRCGGAGLGGIFTPTGVGTVVENGKEKKSINGKTYLLETAIRADVALVKAWKADTAGNLVLRRTARNFNPYIATAANLVIAEADEIVSVGEIDPDDVMVPGFFVDLVVKG